MEGNQIRPWLSGVIELIEHAIEHLDSGSPVDLRFAMIHADNSVELTARTYIEFGDRALYRKIPRKEWSRNNRYFEWLLGKLYENVTGYSDELDGNLAFMHSLRNRLYHQGSGLTVQSEIAEDLVAQATRLISILFGHRVALNLRGYPSSWTRRPLDIPAISSNLCKELGSETVTMYQFIQTVQDLKAKIELRQPSRKTIALPKSKFADFLAIIGSIQPASLSEELLFLWRKRNELVHSPMEVVGMPSKAELRSLQERAQELSERLARELDR